MADAQDTTFEDLAGEPVSSSSLAAHLKSMDSEELLGLADDLRSLVAHPGWLKLAELVELQRAQIEQGASRRLWRHFATGRTLQQQAPFVRLGGLVDGLSRPEKIIGKVLAHAKRERQRIGIDGEG